MDYKILYVMCDPGPEATVEVLEAVVYQYIGEGWEPIGGVGSYSSSDPGGDYIMQAMVKRE